VLQGNYRDNVIRVTLGFSIWEDEMRTFLIISVSAIALVATPSIAQDAEAGQAESTGGLDRIIVTATKRAEDVQDVPIAITAFSAESLERRGVSEVVSLGNLVPNVTLDAGTPFSGSSSVLAAYIRGIGQNDFAFNLDPGVGVYLDGVYLARSVGANQDLLDIERIEILKGPQGTLFGRNSVGGAISIVTQAPGDEFAFRGEVTAGRFGRFDVKGSITVPITDRVSSSLSFSSKNNDGYQRVIPFPGFAAGVISDNFPSFGRGTSDRYGGENQYSMRGKLRIEASDDVTVTLVGDYLSQNNNGVASTLIATTVDPTNPAHVFGPLYNGCIAGVLPPFAQTGVCDNILGGTSLNNLISRPGGTTLLYNDQFVPPSIDTTYATGNNFSRLENFGGAMVLDWDLGFADIKSITSYRELHWESAQDNDGSPLPFLEVSFQTNQEQFSQELQLTGDAVDGRLRYVLGAYYFEESGNLHDLVTFPVGLLQIDGNNLLSTKAYAAYANLNFAITDQVSITLGGRYTEENKRFTGLQSDPNGFFYKANGYSTPNEAARLALCADGAAAPSLIGIPPGLFCYPSAANIYQVYPVAPPGGFAQNFSDFSPKIGLEFAPTDELLIYASWAKGYKTGGWTTRLTTPQPTGTGAPTFGPEEASTFELGVKSELADGRVILNVAGFYTDYTGIQLNFQVGTSPTLANAGDAEIYGLEAELQAAPTDNLTFSAAVGYIHAQYTDIDFGVTGVTTANSLPKTPEWKFSFGPQYTIDLASGAEVFLNADYTHTSSLFNDTENTPLLKRPATDMLNASVTYREPDGNWSLTAGATNLLDDRYLTVGHAQIAGGQIYGTYSRPREWYMTARVNF
jgi:iron complex outermembrane recepter protein